MKGKTLMEKSIIINSQISYKSHTFCICICIHPHFDFEVVKDSDEVEAKLCHGWIDKVCREVFGPRLLARESHMEENRPVQIKNLESCI